MMQAIQGARLILTQPRGQVQPRLPIHKCMEFDWLDVSFDLSKVTPKEIEESFEDPFAVRLLPDGNYGNQEARYICLGRSVGNRPLFSVFWTDGKRYRVIISREMTKEEESFYDRRNAQNV